MNPHLQAYRYLEGGFFMQINYKKKFIILKNKYSTIKGYKAKGHMKLEIKGAHTNINVNIENAEADTSYSLSLIGEEIIQLGKIYTDSYGRTKSELILSTEDFLQGELEQGAVIIHREDEALLGEYLDRDDGRIEDFLREETELEPEPELEPQLEPEPEPEPEAEFEPRFDFEVFEDSEPAEDLEYQYSVKKMEQTTDYILSVLRYFPYAEPFVEELLEHNWWRVEYSEDAEEGFLPYFDYMLETNAINLMRRYGHYLFGLYNQGDEVKYYIYGVPGGFTLEEHPNEGEAGFEKWYEGVDEVGYWLLYIDPMTGQVVEPS